MLLVLDKNIPEHWGYFGQLLERAGDFCQKYDSDADPKELENILISHFAQGSNLMMFLVTVQEGAIVGHLIASLDVWCGARFATILQYELDKGSTIDRTEGKRLLDAWAAMHGVRLQLLARNARIAKLFNRYWGFNPVRILMRN